MSGASAFARSELNIFSKKSLGEFLGNSCRKVLRMVIPKTFDILTCAIENIILKIMHQQVA